MTIDDLLERMTTDEKIGQLFMVSFYGDVADETNSAQVGSNRTLIGADNIAAAIAQFHLGGVIYFTWAGNLDSAKQIATLSNDDSGMSQPRNAEPIPLLISTDQEGGSIVRLPRRRRNSPGNMALGATRSPDLARSTGKAMGEELLAVGINDVLAPVGDVNVNPANPIIGLRSFGADASAVAAMTAAMVRGFQDDAGIGATVKHFPGHGDTNIDSHSQLPVITHSAEQWTTRRQAALRGGDRCRSRLGHGRSPCISGARPERHAGQSFAPIVIDVLRSGLGFSTASSSPTGWTWAHCATRTATTRSRSWRSRPATTSC